MKIVKNSIVYLTGELLNKAIIFSLIPIITKILTPSEYGLFSIYQTVISITAPFQRMSLEINITKNFFKKNEQISQIVNIIIQILLLNSIIILIVFFISILFHKNPFSLPTYVWLTIPILIFFQSLNIFYLTIIRNNEKSIEYVIIQILSSILNFTFTVFLVYYLTSHKWLSLVTALLLSQFLISLYSLYNLKSLLKQFKLFNLKQYLLVYKETSPLIFHLLGGSIIFFSDKLIIQSLQGNHDVGLYTIGSQLGGITTIVISAFLLAINPWIYQSLSKHIDINKKIFMIQLFFLLIGIICWIAIKILYDIIVGNQYKESFEIVTWFTIGFVFRGWYQLYYNYLVHYNYTHVLTWITITIASINIILNFLLIPLYGYIGAGISTTISFLLLFLIVFHIAKKLHKGNKNS